MQNIKKTIIAAPNGLQGVFEIGGNSGDELYLDAVVALAIITLDDEEIVDRKNLSTVPVGIGLDGSLALALVAANGVIHDEGGSWPTMKDWLKTNSAGRLFVKDQFGDDATASAADPATKAGIYT